MSRVIAVKGTVGQANPALGRRHRRPLERANAVIHRT
jgi:hypothetical protein